MQKASIAALLVIPLFLVALAVAQSTPVSKTIPVQGRLADVSGNMPKDGTFSMNFSIYDNDTVGNMLQKFDFPSVSVQQGYFAVNLGPINLPFDRAYWLEVRVGNETLSPRQRLAPAPYAMNLVPDSSINVSSVNANSAGIQSLSVANQITSLNVSQLFTTTLSVIQKITTLFNVETLLATVLNATTLNVNGTLTANNLAATVATITNLTVTGTLNASIPQPAIFFKSGYLTLATGNYTGNGVVRDITGHGFMPIFTFVKRDGDYWAMARSTWAGSHYWETSADNVVGHITRFLPDGFRLGTDANVNANGQSYQYFSLGAESNPATRVKFVTGTYTGDSQNNRGIATPGVNPELVMIISGTTSYGGMWRSSSFAGDKTAFLNRYAFVDNAIQSLTAGGFQVGNYYDVNYINRKYYFVALQKDPQGTAQVATGLYIGSGGEMFISTPFEPDMIWIRSTRGYYGAAIWIEEMGQGVSDSFGATEALADAITGVESGGFWVGANTRVNVGDTQYVWYAFKK